MSQYTAIIPVAGAGTRLRPHTYTYPKVLLTVGDKPILGHILDKVIENKIKKVCFVIGYMGDKVREYVNTNYKNLDVNYVLQEEQRGLGHAVWLTKANVSGPILIILGDTIIEADIPQFLKQDFDKIGVKEVTDPKRFGIVKLNKSGFIDYMVEKPENPPSNMAIVGLYAFKNSNLLYSSLDKISKIGKTTRGEMQLTDAMQMMIKEGHKIKAVKIKGWFDCGKPETLIETNRHILSKKSGKAALKAGKNCLIINPVYISKTAEIKNSIIGPNVSIGEDAVIDNSIISDSIINEGAVIKNGNLDKSLIGPNAFVEGKVESINIGENSEIKLTI
jgi:glucose-1-phosphate thymidylyltransferase